MGLVYRLDRRSIRPFVFRVAQISRLAFRFAQGAVKRAEAGARLGMEGNGRSEGGTNIRKIRISPLIINHLRQFGYLMRIDLPPVRSA